MTSEDCVYNIAVVAEYTGSYSDPKAPADVRSMSSSGSIKQRQKHLKYKSTALVETTKANDNNRVQYNTPINVALFSITALTDSSTVFIPCSARDPPDGFLFSTQAALSVTASATSPANTQTQRQYELCSAPISTTTIPPTEALGILAVSLEQCYGHTSLYICADDGHCSTVLPTTDEWAYSATTTVSCQKLWGPIPTPGR